MAPVVSITRIDILLFPNIFFHIRSTLYDKVVSSNLAHSVVYSIQHYVIKFVSDLRHVGGFSANKTDCHDIAEILLEVAWNTLILVRHSIQHCVIKFVSDLRRVSGFLCQSSWPSRYNWNIVESGVKHHNPSTFTLTRHWGLLVRHLLQMIFLQNPNLLKKLQFYFYWLTDWLVFNANFSNILDISWRTFINCLSSKLLYIWSFCENLFKRWNIKPHRWCDGWRARLECGKSCGRCHGRSNHNLYNWHLLLS